MEQMRVQYMGLQYIQVVEVSKFVLGPFRSRVKWNSHFPVSGEYLDGVCLAYQDDEQRVQLTIPGAGAEEEL